MGCVKVIQAIRATINTRLRMLDLPGTLLAQTCVILECQPPVTQVALAAAAIKDCLNPFVTELHVAP
jgi:hypothetical protein